MARISTPEHLPGATQFSGDAAVNDPIWLIRTMRQTQWAYAPLREAVASLEQNWGRRRAPGEWALPYFAFVVSGRVDIQPWHAETSAALWREAGFNIKPPYSRVYARFTELEDLADDFIACAGRMIQHARRHDSRVGQHVHVDSTEAETHAGLKHVCCSQHSRRAARPRRVATADVREERQAEAAEAPPAHPSANMGAVDAVRDQRNGRYFKINGHWYRSIDKTAGIRAYTGPRGAVKFWHGYYNQKAIDHFTGGVLAVDVFSASEQEYHSYPALAQQLETSLGARPQAVVFDRGFSVASVFEHNTTRGIATVAPWRKWGTSAGREMADQLTHDRHGIPRCKHCGGDSRFVRFHENGGKPRTWFHCIDEQTTKCLKDQSISCSVDWRLLVPLWRTDDIYHELRASHSQYERGQHHWRQRYLVAGDDRVTRPKRRGLGWQRLRAAAALNCEWIRILHREGWLGSARTNRHQPERDDRAGRRNAARLVGFRHKVGLDRPYGPKAHRLGIGPLQPPTAPPRRAGSQQANSGSGPPTAASP